MRDRRDPERRRTACGPDCVRLSEYQAQLHSFDHRPAVGKHIFRPHNDKEPSVPSPRRIIRLSNRIAADRCGKGWTPVPGPRPAGLRMGRRRMRAGRQQHEQARRFCHSVPSGRNILLYRTFQFGNDREDRSARNRPGTQRSRPALQTRRPALL